jgi:hypothetical protein
MSPAELCDWPADALLIGAHRIGDSIFLQLAVEGGLADAK